MTEVEEIKQSLQELKQIMVTNFAVVNATLSEHTKSMNQYHKDNDMMRREFSNINKRLEKLESKTKHL